VVANEEDEGKANEEDTNERNEYTF